MMPGGSRPAARPVDDKRLAGLIEPVAESVGLDLEAVRVKVIGRERRLEVVVDSDAGVSLDELSDASRAIAKALDASNIMGEAAYNLEVSSPGVTRPLTKPRHWRRATGRLVKVKAVDEGTLRGRVTEAGDDGVTLDIDGTRRDFAYEDLGAATVQVEFGKIPDSALEDLSEGDDPDDDLGDEDPDAGTGTTNEEDLGAGGDGH